MSAQDQKPLYYEIIIIGTGFSGVGLAIQLQKAGRDDFLLLEKADSVGGCWRDNTYPGAACDVPSNLYSFSFEPNPNWSRRYSSHHEIRVYIENCIKKYQLESKIAYGKEVISMGFDSEQALWNVETHDGTHYQAKHLVSAIGQLSRPAVPVLKGIEQFKGKVFHSAQWDHDYDLAGKKIAVIGTGASAIQFVPAIVDQVASCTLFQRSAPYVLSKPDGEYKAWQKKMFSRFPLAQKLSRFIWYLRYESRALLFGKYKYLNYLPKLLWQWEFNKTIKSESLREKLTPDYQIGCKRVLIANDYYASFNKPQMELNTTGIESVTENSVITKGDEEIELDAIIYGTGFKATEFLQPMQVTGLDNQDLNQVWAKGAEAYKGIAIHGFPNLMMLYGPNTNSGHNSIIYNLEGQIQYIVSFIEQSEVADADYFDVKESSQASYNQMLQRELAATVWATGGCNSWYQTQTGKIVNNWPGFSFSYRRQVRKVTMADYKPFKKAEGA